MPEMAIERVAREVHFRHMVRRHYPGGFRRHTQFPIYYDYTWQLYSTRKSRPTDLLTLL